MKIIASLICVLCLLLVFACGGQQAQEGQTPQASQQAQPTATAEQQPEPEPEAPAVASLGTVTAKLDQDATEITFDVKTAVLSHARGKFTICLSALVDDEVLKWGFFPNTNPDGVDFHRIEIYFQETPTAPGEFEMERFNYAAKDPNTDVDTGWTGSGALPTGKVILDSVEGELPAGSGGVEVRPAKISGSFSATTTKGGAFSGTFTAVGVE